MHVLVTRPEADCEGQRMEFEALGLTVSMAPLIEIQFEVIPATRLLGSAALVATSRNGLRALARYDALKTAHSIPLFVVGAATAALAREIGFTDVRTGAGTATALGGLISDSKHEFGGRPLVHLAGDQLAFDLKTELAAHAINLDLVPAYRTIPAGHLPDAVRAELQAGQIDAVILMSPRTARIWSQVAGALGPSKITQNLTHVCLSQAVAEALQPGPAVRVEIAAHPSSEEIVGLIRRLAADRRTE